MLMYVNARTYLNKQQQKKCTVMDARTPPHAVGRGGRKLWPICSNLPLGAGRGGKKKKKAKTKQARAVREANMTVIVSSYFQTNEPLSGCLPGESVYLNSMIRCKRSPRPGSSQWKNSSMAAQMVVFIRRKKYIC